MISVRNAVIIVLVALAVYALLPASRKTRLIEKIRGLWRALVISLILFWILILGRAWFSD